MSKLSAIRILRSELGLTLQDLGGRVGLSKSQMHEVERTGRATLRVALAIEALSSGKLDASELCEEVRMARQTVHDLSDSIIGDESSPGNAQNVTAAQQSEAA